MTVTGYTKLFSSIVHSTIWRQPDHVRLVWVTMLALSDRHGEVHASMPGLADAARVTVDQCEAALKHLSGPDLHSRTKDHGGRRIEPCEGGWSLLNHALYREKMSADDQRAKARERQRRKRARDKGPVTPPVTAGNEMSRPSRQAEAEADTKAKADAPLSGGDAGATPPPRRKRRKASTKRATSLPPDWSPTEAHWMFASKHGMDRDAVLLEVVAFRGWYEGRKELSWNGRFTTWLAKSIKWRKEGKGRYGAPAKTNIELQKDRIRMLEAKEAAEAAEKRLAAGA